jgi:diguanylate cyclase (GGDEF)-like protein/PAS domain S-box-containing protein
MLGLVSKISLKFKYACTAFLTLLLCTVATLALQIWQHRDNVEDLRAVASEAGREQVLRELKSQSVILARQAALVAHANLAPANPAALLVQMQDFVDQHVLAAVTLDTLVVRDPEGSVLFQWHQQQPATATTARWQVLQPIAENATTPSLGEVRLVLASDTAATAAILSGQLSRASRTQLQRNLQLTSLLGLIAALLGAWVSWRTGARLGRPIVGLIRGVDRISQGDYTRPTDVLRKDELGELQHAVERMRTKLRHSTVNKEYVYSVLNSMSDAVFVTSPDGVIKIVNFAACKMLQYAEEEILGRSITAMLDEAERPKFDLLRAASETSETVMRTRGGNTIPVSLSGAPISSDDPQFQGSIFAARNITENKRTEQRIRYLARYDALTKIPNRMQFQHLLQQAITRALRGERGVALLYLDMDHFKEVNDTFGHTAGDRLLETLAERLSRTLPRDTVVGRLAGDEFALFIDNLPGDTDNRSVVAQLARHLLAELGRAYSLSEHEVFLTASIGIAFCSRDAENVIDLIRNADAAMYYAKQNGGNTFAFYSPEMNAAAVERLMLKSKLRRALEQDQLVIRYQPKIDLRNGKIVGAEALLRWRLAGHGDISPAQFIPLAEETSLILDIGEWVLNRVCLDYKKLQAEITNPGRVSLNLSLKQLRQASFILRCRSVFRQHGVSPTAFELEITETTLMTDSKRTVRLLDELYAMGLHLSIDDFGTGYSSLSALQQFPIGTLKVDQSFVRDVSDDPADATIVRTIIDMGRSLGLEVVAEGVESLRHVEFLYRHHCYFAQGKLFGEPCTAEELRALLTRQANGTPVFAALLAQTTGPFKTQIA